MAYPKVLSLKRQAMSHGLPRHSDKPKVQRLVGYDETIVKGISHPDFEPMRKSTRLKDAVASPPSQATASPASLNPVEAELRHKARGKQHIGETRQRMNPITLRWEDVD